MMSESERIVREWFGTYNPKPEDLARRIDAALAESEQRLRIAKDEARGAEYDAGLLRAELAEREAQIAALRRALSVMHQHWHGTEYNPCQNCSVVGVLNDTADAARAFVERIQAEERERLIKVICRWCKQDYELKEVHTAQWEDEPWTHFKNGLPIAPCEAAAIRALPPRRGT